MTDTITTSYGGFAIVGGIARSASCQITLGSSPCRGLARPHSTVPGVG
jgi:hypothetical protein